jgi:GTPase SAR1 family protein
MQVRRDLDQHIAVFGEGGSGKTVLLSSFYGGAQEPQFDKESLFYVVADDPGQGDRLEGNYVGMKRSAQLPIGTHFAATSYSFSVKFKERDPDVAKTRPFDDLRLVWHDYPGEWFTQDVMGEEATRRLEGFRSLLGSDVSLLLVDGQKLLDHSGAEEKYLKVLLTNVKTTLLRLKDDLLPEGKLVAFPRIWILALSKADLLPEMDVTDFKELLKEKVAGEIDQLRKVLAEFVQGPEAMSVFEDFLLLSSAKFGETQIDVTKRVGLDLILPLAAMLPLERHSKWAESDSKLPPAVRKALLDGIGPLALVLIGAATKILAKYADAESKLARYAGPIAVILGLVGPPLIELLNRAVDMKQEELRDINSEALAKKDYLRATLARFQEDLHKGEEAKLLIRSRR